jgi:hypothetical protein
MRTLFLTLITCLFVLPAHAKYSGGTGEPNDPYQIATAADLIALGETPEDYNKHFILTADIDLDPNLPGRKVFDRAVIAPDTDPASGFQGTPFTGVFDGGGHTITHLTVIGHEYLGLLGSLFGQVRNLGVVDVCVSGSGDEVGGLAGYVGYDGAALVECYSSGTVRGNRDVGGLVGYNSGTVTLCYSTGVVRGSDSVGGLVGGDEEDYLVQCYSTCVVNGTGNCIGGLVGSCYANTVTQCYSTGAVRGQKDVGGLIGDAGEVKIWDSYWDIESSGQTISAGGTGKTTAEMQTASTFFMWVSCENEIVWTIDEGNDYPRLWWEKQLGEPIRVEPLSDFLTGTGTEEDPFLIYTPEQVNRIGLYPCEWDKHFKLMSDIDLSGFDGKAGRPAFNPIGVCTQVIEASEGRGGPTYQLVGTPFTGAFEGNGHVISNLTLESQGRCAGLFGGLRGGQVKNLGVVDVNIAALDGPVGALVGHNSGTVTGCYSTGVVSGDSYVGGLVGYSVNSITHCYSAVAVSGNYAVGGLVGYNGFGSHDYSVILIHSCYSTGMVNGVSAVGGLVGSGWPGYVKASCWDMQTSGQTSSAGGTGKTTAQMQDEDTFICWADYGVWTIDDGKDYPRLGWENASGQAISRAYFYGGGHGTPGDPYLIYTADQLNTIGTIECDLNKHFKLMADIDLLNLDGKNGRPAFSIIGAHTNPNDPWVDFTGTPFAGVFDGKGHAISHLTLEGKDYVGLFGYSSGEVKNLGIVDVNIVGSTYVGGLVGENHGLMAQCYSTGIVSGHGYVGGLAGWNSGTLTRCCSTCAVTGRGSYVGGLVGAHSYGNITLSFSTGVVNGRYDVGGLVGADFGTVTQCYSIAEVIGESHIGGLVGYLRGDGTVTGCYSAGTVSGTGYAVGGLVGQSDRCILRSLWDVEASGLSTSDGGLGLTRSEITDPYMLGLNGFGNDPNWVLDAGRDYPRLAWEGSGGEIIPAPDLTWLPGQGTAEDPYRIDTANQLILLNRASVLWDKHLVLDADVDLDPNLPNGQVFAQAVIPDFTGVFDGRGHTISHLTIVGESRLGLFGRLEGEINDLGVVDVNITGSGSYVGGLVGKSGGTVTQCYNTGAVSGTVSHVGGLVGSNDEGRVTFCYSTAAVTGGYEGIGGLVGSNHHWALVSFCYSTGWVTRGGGLVGAGEKYMVFASFWDTQSSGRAWSCGGTGRTTAEMQTAKTFLDAGWDFVGETANGTQDLWWILEGKDYPRLWWQTAEQ